MDTEAAEQTGRYRKKKSFSQFVSDRQKRRSKIMRNIEYCGWFCFGLFLKEIGKDWLCPTMSEIWGKNERYLVKMALESPHLAKILVEIAKHAKMYI